MDLAIHNCLQVLCELPVDSLKSSFESGTPSLTVILHAVMLMLLRLAKYSFNYWIFWVSILTFLLYDLLLVPWSQFTISLLFRDYADTHLSKIPTRYRQLYLEVSLKRKVDLYSFWSLKNSILLWTGLMRSSKINISQEKIEKR